MVSPMNVHTVCCDARYCRYENRSWRVPWRRNFGDTLARCSCDCVCIGLNGQHDSAKNSLANRYFVHSVFVFFCTPYSSTWLEKQNVMEKCVSEVKHASPVIRYFFLPILASLHFRISCGIYLSDSHFIFFREFFLRFTYTLCLISKFYCEHLFYQICIILWGTCVTLLKWQRSISRRKRAWIFNSGICNLLCAKKSAIKREVSRARQARVRQL